METIEETLKSSDIPTELMEFIVETDVIEGARPALVAEQVVRVDRRLIGRDGNSVRFPLASQLTASTASEEGEMTTSDKTPTQVSVTIDTKVYSAVALTKELLEDYPSINWIRLHFRNMGWAVRTYIDTAIVNHLIDNAGLNFNAGGSLSHDNVIDAVKTMAGQNFKARYLLVHPTVAGSLLKDTSFINAQSQYYRISDLLNGEVGMLAGVRVLETTQIDASRCILITDPNDTITGPNAVVAYKRDLTVTTDTDADYDRQRWYTTMRYGLNTIQANTILLISATA